MLWCLSWTISVSLTPLRNTNYVTLTKIVLFRYVSESETGALRKCCVDKTYDPRVLACCQDGILKQHGTCGIWIFLSIKIIQRVIFYISLEANSNPENGFAIAYL